jgi:hypothetical protein
MSYATRVPTVTWDYANEETIHVYTPEGTWQLLWAIGENDDGTYYGYWDVWDPEGNDAGNYNDAEERRNLDRKRKGRNSIHVIEHRMRSSA